MAEGRLVEGRPENVVIAEMRWKCGVGDLAGMCRRLGFGVLNPTQACAAEADCLWFLLLGIRSILATDNA